TGNVQQGRLAGTRWPDQRHHLARPHLKISALDHFQKTVAGLAEALLDVLQFERRLTHNAAPRPDRAGLRARPDRATPAASAPAPWRRLRLPRWDRRSRAAWTGNRPSR